MNNNKRQKDTRTLVQEIFIVHPEWNARQIYDRYLILIGDTNKAVTLNAVQKHVENLREIHNKTRNLDEPWHLHQTLNMPAEAIAHILEVQKVMPKWVVLPPSLSEPNPESYVIYEGAKLTAIPRCMTVREAQWVARLYAVKSLKNVRVLAKVALVYSLLERLSNLSEIPLDTSEVDEIIKGNKNIEDALDRYFSRLSPGTWLELVKDFFGIQKITIKRGAR